MSERTTPLLGGNTEAMSNDRIELVQSLLDGFSRGDLDAAFKAVAPDAELDMSRAVGLTRGVYKRAEEISAILDEFNSNWESVRYAADEFIEAGDDLVVPFTNRLRGRDGIELVARGVWVITIRDNLITRACLYQERDEALASVGLR